MDNTHCLPDYWRVRVTLMLDVIISKLSPLQVIIVFIGFFFAGTGVIAILGSLIRTFENPGADKSDSSLDIKGFKISAPAGFIYGIAAIIIVVMLIKFNDQIITEQESKNYYEVNYNNDSTFVNVKFDSQRPASIFNGEVLISKNNSNRLTLVGIIGASEQKNGKFEDNYIYIDEGEKFYVILSDSTLWGVNVISRYDPTELEFYVEKTTSNRR